MDVAYYPGCSLHGTAREYGESARRTAESLGIYFHELDDWNCCGASSAHSVSDELAFSLTERNLRKADKTGMDLVVSCASCFQRLKRGEKELLTKEEIRDGYSGEHTVRYITDFIWEELGEKALAAKVTRPLTGLKAVSYYGCLSVRPPRITDTRDEENPLAIDSILETIGAEVKPWSYKTDCCGGGLSFTTPEVSLRLVENLVAMAKEAGAECIVTACPLCQANMDNGQRTLGHPDPLPVFYITELMVKAMGQDAGKWLGMHMIDPRPLVKRLGLD